MGLIDYDLYKKTYKISGTPSGSLAPGLKKEVVISYNKRQFYDRILTPMKTMGLIDYDLYKKTYKISEKFNKNMMRIGLMWLQELRKPPREFNIKK
jgi:hypothetical protein